MSALPDNALPAMPEASPGGESAAGEARLEQATPAAQGEKVSAAGPTVELPEELRQPWRPPDGEGAVTAPGTQPPAEAFGPGRAAPAATEPAAPASAWEAVLDDLIGSPEGVSESQRARLQAIRQALPRKLDEVVAQRVESVFEHAIMPRLVEAARQLETIEAGQRREAQVQAAYDARADSIARAAEQNLLRLVPGLGAWDGCEEMTQFVYPIGVRVMAEMGIQDTRAMARMTEPQMAYLIQATAQRVQQQYGNYLAYLTQNGRKGTPRVESRESKAGTAAGGLGTEVPGHQMATPPVLVTSGGFVPSAGLPPMLRARSREQEEVEPVRRLMADWDGVSKE